MLLLLYTTEKPNLDFVGGPSTLIFIRLGLLEQHNKNYFYLFSQKHNNKIHRCSNKSESKKTTT